MLYSAHLLTLAEISVYALTKDKPAPHRGKSGRQAKYPFAIMEVGDSFFCPREAFESSPGITGQRVGGAARAWARRLGNGHKFITRAEHDGCRIWRIA